MKAQKIQKKNRNAGFTLVELIIVVMILAILIGLLAPMYTHYVARSKAAVDGANVQSAKNAAQVAFIEDGIGGTSGKATYYYDGAKEKIVDKPDGIKPYGKSNRELPDDGAEGTPKGNFIRIEIDANGKMSAFWGAGSEGSSKKQLGDVNNNPLVNEKIASTWNTKLKGDGKIWGKGNNGNRSLQVGEAVVEDGIVYIYYDKTKPASVPSAKDHKLKDFATPENGYAIMDATTPVLSLDDLNAKDFSCEPGTILYNEKGDKYNKYYIAVKKIEGTTDYNNKSSWVPII